jgi:AbrB family looped-hinge helix DNA binding protein
MKTILIRTIGRRNQVTIPAQLLERLGLHPGDFINFIPEKNGILLRPVEVVEREEWTKEELSAIKKSFIEQKQKKEYISFVDTKSAISYLRKIIKKK